MWPTVLAKLTYLDCVYITVSVQTAALIVRLIKGCKDPAVVNYFRSFPTLTRKDTTQLATGIYFFVLSYVYAAVLAR